MDTTVFRLALKRELRGLLGRFASLAKTILERARAGESELTILYTHGQPANVSTMAHYLTAFLLELLEGTESLLWAMRSTDRCTLGACAITGTGFAIDRDRTPGRFLLTGSANLLLMRQVSESLAGRASDLTLWPMTRREQRGLGRCGSARLPAAAASRRRR
jgi:hypothetical protein